MKKYTITVNGTAYEVEVEEAGVVASAPKAAPAPAAAAIVYFNPFFMLNAHLSNV